MRPVVEFLLDLRTKNVSLTLEGNQLVCEAPPGVLTPDIRERMSAFKPEILRLLATASVIEPAVTDEQGQDAPGLSRSQRSIWLLEQLSPGTATWNVSWALDVRGVLDREVLEASFRSLLDRHTALRSRFLNIDGTPVVEHAPLGRWSIEYTDLRGLSDAEQRAANLATAEVQRPFDLERGPLVRVSLLQTAEDRHSLVLVVHHIVADGWSLGLMGAELSRIYRAHLLGDVRPLPPPRADYQGFVRQERDDERASQPDLDWWCRKLSGELPIVSLAADAMRIRSGAGRRVSIDLGPDLMEGIDGIARQHGATIFMVLLAAFKLLLHRYTGQTDMMVGVQTSGRHRPEFAQVIGMFVNTLVRETALEAFAHQHVAFDRIVEAVQPRRQPGQNPLVQHAFAFQNLPPAVLQLGSAELAHKPLELAGARYELSVEIWRTPDSLICDFEYATDLFDAETIDRMMRHYKSLIEAALIDPDRRISHLPMLSDAERDQLLNRWNDTAAQYPVERRLDRHFAEQAAKTPDAPALVCRGRDMSYRELDRRSNQLAHHLRTLGVGPDVLVGVCLERSPDLIVTIMAILKAGGAYVPLDPNYPIQRLAFMLEDSGAPVLVTRSALRRTLAANASVVDLDIVQASLSALPQTAPETGATADHLAYVIYTSGSTGRPKGTKLRHSAGYLVDWARRSFTPQELSRVVAATSICFDLSVFEIFVPLCTGGAVLLVADPLEPPDPASRPTLLNSVPSALAELARLGAIPDTVSTVIVCGEKLNRNVVQALYEAAKVERVYNLYGPTEYTTYATAALAARDAGQDPPIGRPLSNTRVYVLDGQGEPVPIGVAGELHIAGHGLALGYLGRPELTAERFIHDPFGPPGGRMYRTGDLVRWTSEGQLEFVGRIDHQVKLRGFRIELGEIEATFLRHPAVRDVVVVARPIRADDTRLIAYVVPEGEPPSATELRRYARDWLPEYMVPSAFVVLAGFPLTPSGKIDRAALPPPGSDEHPEPAPDTEWMSPIEEVIADTFKQVLQLDDFGTRDNFFDKGGHSLLVVRATAQLERLLAQPISPAWIFQAPTPGELAPLLDATLIKPTSHIAPLQPLGDRPPLFCLHDLFSRPLNYVSLARLLAPDQPVYGLMPGPLEDALIRDPSFDLLTPAYIAAIRSVQPRGPYRIVGYSFGGLPAFDIARALEDAGEEVLLIMIDPYVYRAMPTVTQAVKWASRHGRRALKEIWTADQPAWPKIRETTHLLRRQARRAFKRLSAALDPRAASREAVLLSEVPDWVPPSSQRLALALLRAEANYRYRPFSGRAVFVQGTVRNTLLDFLNADGLNGWSGLLTGPLTRLEMAANHVWIMRDPRVTEVAQLLRSL
jgi:amino acid adenylation domain-containing protein